MFAARSACTFPGARRGRPGCRCAAESRSRPGFTSARPGFVDRTLGRVMLTCLAGSTHCPPHEMGEDRRPVRGGSAAGPECGGPDGHANPPGDAPEALRPRPLRHLGR